MRRRCAFCRPPRWLGMGQTEVRFPVSESTHAFHVMPTHSIQLPPPRAASAAAHLNTFSEVFADPRRLYRLLTEGCVGPEVAAALPSEEQRREAEAERECLTLLEKTKLRFEVCVCVCVCVCV